VVRKRGRIRQSGRTGTKPKQGWRGTGYFWGEMTGETYTPALQGRTTVDERAKKINVRQKKTKKKQGQKTAAVE